MPSIECYGKRLENYVMTKEVTFIKSEPSHSHTHYHTLSLSFLSLPPFSLSLSSPSLPPFPFPHPLLSLSHSPVCFYNSRFLLWWVQTIYLASFFWHVPSSLRILLSILPLVADSAGLGCTISSEVACYLFGRQLDRLKWHSDRPGPIEVVQRYTANNSSIKFNRVKASLVLLSQGHRFMMKPRFPDRTTLGPVPYNTARKE